MIAPDPAPLDPVVQDTLRQVAAGPLSARPVDQVLAEIGSALPQFPPLPPLPGLPPLPVLDPAMLLKPITDLLGQFGTGRLGDIDGANPQQILSGVANGMNQAISMGTQALGLLSGMAGQGTQSAANKATAAQANAGEVATQAGAIDSIVTQAAMTVQVGNAALAGIAAKTASTSAALAAVPGGQPAVVAVVAEGAAESAAVVAAVRAQLGIHTAEMEAAGQPVSVTSAPNAAGGDPQQMLQQVLQLVQPLTQMLQQGSRALQQNASRQELATAEASGPSADQGTGVAPGGAPLAGYVAGAAAAGAGAVQHRTLQAYQAGGLRVAGITNPVTMGGGASSSGSVTGETVTRTATAAAPMMPIAPLAAAARAGDPGNTAVHDPLVTGQLDDEVVAAPEAAASPVVGVVGDDLSEPPDKALTL
ncbi:hypothetical protein AB0B25_17440 [Nocardia sp. NPDC049190]|uniref:hypothetical protein n=1 Tax=Nocardia sp. NPDC049190 TaxID=3155650 RepID=UPI0033D1D9E8